MDKRDAFTLHQKNRKKGFQEISEVSEAASPFTSRGPARQVFFRVLVSMLSTGSDTRAASMCGFP